MGALDEFLSAEKGVQPSDMGWKGEPKVAPKTDQRLSILQKELADEQAKLKSGDTRAQANIDAINREIKFVGGGKAAAKPAEPVSLLDDFLSQSDQLGPSINVEVAGGVQEQPTQPTQPHPLLS